ncbi:MAG: hypothetical protein ACRDVK_06490 [Acidimicrobiia bacterium]
MSASLLSRPQAIVAGWSAAQLHGFPGARRGRPVILVPASGNARSTLAHVVRSEFFDDVERRYVSGFPVTSPAETILTLAAKRPTWELERLVDDALVSGAADIEDFDRLRKRRVPGSKRLAEIVDLRRDTAYQPPTSELERLLEPTIRHPDVPPVSRQHPLLRNGVAPLWTAS